MAGMGKGGLGLIFFNFKVDLIEWEIARVTGEVVRHLCSVQYTGNSMRIRIVRYKMCGTYMT
jgi:hypothetical protein